MIWLLLLLISGFNCLPERGRVEISAKKGIIEFNISKSMFNGTYIDIKITCDTIHYVNGTLTLHSQILPCLNSINYKLDNNIEMASNNIQVSVLCHKDISEKIKDHSGNIYNNQIFMNKSDQHLLTTSRSGIYAFKFSFQSLQTDNFTMSIELKSAYGYLSAMEWPLLVFYSVMCGLYSVLALVWFVLSCRNWRDLLRIQFWIGAVIFLGMLEKALFVSEYKTINNTGVPLNYPVLIAEIVSCIKRMLARILIMIVCIGYGIVKPRLGPAMKRIIGVGIVYLIAALVECVIRVLYPQLNHSNYMYIPNLILVLTDSVIMWWSFSYLIQTIKEMRIRHNVVKFNLYRHFSNILIIVIVASVLFMAWFLYTFKSSNCITSWNEIWINEAFWHILFSVVLMTIMVLWRPSKNSQRYAYSPLLDEENLDFGDDDEEENVSMDNLTSGELRKPNKDGREKKVTEKKTAEDDLRWIEENIPASAAEKIYPIIDSEEEITPSKITSGKMD